MTELGSTPKLGYTFPVDTLSQFHPIVAQWFQDVYGSPTDIQAQCWPLIASGKHVLMTAPTGSGKTLAAFLHALNGFCNGTLPTGRTSILYVSPLKALNNDLRVNLMGPLSELRQRFDESGTPFPYIQVGVRSGDTPQSERQRMIRKPPEILVTTPESLNLLLSSRGGISLLGDIKTVILDEIHAVAATKRGTHLISALERLTLLSGEFQRIAVSATVRPMETIAAFVGGYERSGPATAPAYTPRPVSIIRSADEKKVRITIRTPAPEHQSTGEDNAWKTIVKDIKDRLRSNRSTLIFVNGRKHAEKIAALINSGEREILAYTHHGSLSKEIREVVEKRLKNGELRAIVATNSLELGIDVGTLDEVILIQSPASLSSTLQKVGRAGHRVGEVSRGILYNSHPHDLLESTILAPEVEAGHIEAISPVVAPLDILAQIIISMTALEQWDIDDLYSAIRMAWPYQTLSREHFDLVLGMLCGRYEEARIRELTPRVSLDRMDNTVRAKKGALLALYASGGTIPDRGYYNIKDVRTGERIGQLDEEFVWEARVGHVFTLGTRNWRVERITHNDVLVNPASNKAIAIPFWRADPRSRSFYLSERLALFLEQIDHTPPKQVPDLLKHRGLDDEACTTLSDYLQQQREHSRAPLPHRHHILVELAEKGPEGAPGGQIIVHMPWGLPTLWPYTLALGAALERSQGRCPEIFPSNDSFALILPDPIAPGELLSLVTRDNVQELLAEALEQSGLFNAMFREGAGRALLIERKGFGQRLPLWMSRLKSQRLFDAVRAFGDFPIVLEAWRSCLHDMFDLQALDLLLKELESGEMAWSETHTSTPSPFARNSSWTQVNDFIYRPDQQRGSGSPGLRQDLVREAVLTPGMRPAVSRDQVQRFEEKRRRLFPGYAPSTPDELLDWLRERLLLPEPEWKTLLTAMADGQTDEDALATVRHKIAVITSPALDQPLYVALDSLPRLQNASALPDRATITTLDEAPVQPQDTPPDNADELFPAILGECLSFHGPLPLDALVASYGFEAQRCSDVLDDLIEAGSVVFGKLVESETEQYCDATNFETILRMARSQARPVFEPRPVEELPLFIAQQQGVLPPANGTLPESQTDALFESISTLSCFPLPAALWENDILPSRCENGQQSEYDTSMLDECLHDGLLWRGATEGTSAKQVMFCLEEDLDLLDMSTQPATESVPEGNTPEADESSPLFPDAHARYTFPSLQRATSLSPDQLAKALWQEVWNGTASNDSYASMRNAIGNKFKIPSVTALTENSPGRHRGRRSLRSALAKRKGTLPMAGNWFALPLPAPPLDALDALERDKDRVRLLQERYGILYKQLLEREAPPFKWAKLFKALRLMELSGELVTGDFFGGCGLQFMSADMFRNWSPGKTIDEKQTFWLSASDPASLCGRAPRELKKRLPARRSGVHIVYQGTEIILTSEKSGKRLTFMQPPEASATRASLTLLDHLLERRVSPLPSIELEEINGESPQHSSYLDVLREHFSVVADHKTVRVFKKR